MNVLARDLRQEDPGAYVSFLTDEDEDGGSGATLAASLVREDLVDEYRLFTHPVALGGGTPFLPSDTDRQTVQLVGSHDFGTGVAYRADRRVHA